MILITSVASLIISFKLGYLINMSVWSSAFFPINRVQAREAEGWFHLYCIQLAAIKAKPSKWILFNIQLISSTVRYWQDLLGLLVQFAGLLAKGSLWCSVIPFNPSLAGRLCPVRSRKAVPCAPTFLSNFSAVSRANHGCKTKALLLTCWNGADVMLVHICVWTCLEREEVFAEITDNRAVNLGSVITTPLILKIGMEMTTMVPVR